MKNSIFEICGQKINPGEKSIIALSVPERQAYTSYHLPFSVLNGKLPGPVLLVFGGLDCFNLSSTLVTNQLLKSINLKKLKGTLILVPFVNVYESSEHLVNEPLNKSLGNYFPGDQSGSFMQRLAHAFYHEIFLKSQYCIELQGFDKAFLCMSKIFCDCDNAESYKLGKIFDAPLYSDIKYQSHLLSQLAQSQGIHYIKCKLSEHSSLINNSVATGTKGIKNVLHSLDMLDLTQPKEKREHRSQWIGETQWLHSHTQGILQNKIKLNQPIKKSDTIFHLEDIFRLNPKEDIKAPDNVIIISKTTSKIVFSGDKLFEYSTLPAVAIESIK